MLTTPFEDTDAFKLGLIDAKGKRIKSEKIVDAEQKSAFTTFHRLVFNIKKLMAKIPFGSSKLASYAAALFLVKEHFGVSDKNLERIVEKTEIDSLDFMTEESKWYLLDDRRLSPGVYKLHNEKLLSDTLEEAVLAKDSIRVGSESYPVGIVFGLDIYEAQHVKTGKKVHFTIGEIYR
jgi:hypothetical protein